MTSHFADRRKSYFLVIGLVAMFVVLIAAAVLAFSRTSSAAPQGTVKENTIRGEVYSITNSRHLGTLTLLSENLGAYPNDEMNIFLTKNTKVKICSVREPEKDIAASRSATVKYHEIQGLAVADSVSERC